MTNHAPIFTARRRLQAATRSPIQRYSERDATFGGTVGRLGHPGRVASSFTVKAPQVQTITSEEEPILPETTVTHPASREQKKRRHRYFDDAASHIARHA
jgi:hypothetical protein